MRLLLLLLLMSVVLCSSGCSHVMSETLRKQVDTTVSYHDLAAKPDIFVGKTVMVGGVLERISGAGDVTTLEVARLELLSNGVPDDYSASTERFFAISAELIDPARYSPGNLVTIIGEVKGRKTVSRNGVDYSYPLLTIREIRFFRSSYDMPDLHPNPYQPVAGDDRFILSPPGLPGGEPRKFR